MTRSPLIALALVSLAAVAATVAGMRLAGMTGVDTAAHAYRIELVRQGQSLSWDGLWYSGSYGILGYGAIYYLLAAVTGAVPILVVSAGLLPLLFHLYVGKAWRITSYAPAIALAAVVVVYLANGQDPFLMSMALTMAGLALLARDRPVWGALPVALALFTNPLAPVAGAVFVVAEAIAWREARRRAALFAAALAPFFVVWLALLHAFSGRTGYLAEPTVLLKYVAIAALGIVLARFSDDPDKRAKRILFAVFGALCLVALALPFLGNNAGRFFVLFGLPAFLMIRRPRLPRWATAAILAAVALLQLGATLTDFVHTDQFAASHEPFFRSALAVARREHDPAYRIHVVALARHWESYYFPLAGYPITRGWFRQDDWQHNRTLYDDPGPRRYVAWLRGLGVDLVFVPHSALDYSSRQEPGLIAASGAFDRIYDDAHWTVYRLRDPQPLAVPATPGAPPASSRQATGEGARVVTLEHAQVMLEVTEPGRYLVKVTWSPYWLLEQGRGSLGPARGGWTTLEARDRGPYVMRLRPEGREVARRAL